MDVPANGRATVEFHSLDVPYGFSRCEVRIDSADSLPADDASLFAVKRSDPRKVLFVHESGDTRSPLYFRSALASAAESAFNLETRDRGSGGQCAACRSMPSSFFPTWLRCPRRLKTPLTNTSRRRQRLDRRGNLAARHPRVPIFGDNILESRYYSRDGARFLTVGETDPSYPSVGKADRWSGVKFYFAVRVAGTTLAWSPGSPIRRRCCSKKKSAKAASCCSPPASTI